MAKLVPLTAPRPLRRPIDIESFLDGSEVPEQAVVEGEKASVEPALDSSTIVPLALPSVEVDKDRPAPRGSVSSKSSSPSKNRRGVVSLADGTERRRVTVYLEPEVAHALLVHCFENGVTQTELASEALKDGLSRRILGPWGEPKMAKKDVEEGTQHYDPRAVPHGTRIGRRDD